MKIVIGKSHKRVFYLVLVVVLLVAVGSVFYFRRMSALKGTSDATLDNLVSYTVPPGWKKEVKNTSSPDSVSIYSPDYKADTGVLMEIKSGVVISMAQQKAPAGETVDTFVSNSKLNGVDMSQSTRLTLAGQPAVHYFLWYEGFYDRYTFLKDGNEWFIVIQLPGSSKDEALKLENNYKTQINQFLQSLRFR